MPREPYAAEAVVLPVETRWYCLRAQPKREAVAHAALLELPEVESFFPRVRYTRGAADGPRPVTEALFPNYLFARFSPAVSARAVCYARGVAYIVKHGRDISPVPDGVLAELQALAAARQVLELPPDPWRLGEQVRVMAGIFRGTAGRIVGLAPARQRVRVLLELLGRENAVDFPLDALEPRHANPLRATPA